jgi:CheY-like chemotaxis protein
MIKLENVILIDDNKVDLYINNYVIEKSGLADSIISFTSAVEAIEYLSTIRLSSSDLILLDIQMPVMNGFEFLEKIENKIKTPLPKIIMLSSSKNERDFSVLSQFSIVSGWILKPLSVEKLLEHFQ